MKKIHLLAIAIFFTCNVFAQQCCYIITENNDTIHCVKIKIAAIGMAIKFRQNDKDKFTTLMPEDVKEFRIDSNVCRVIKSSSMRPYAFARRIEYGRICLYEGKQTTGNFFSGNTFTTTNWYISKDDSPPTLLKSSYYYLVGPSRSKRKNELADMLADDPQLVANYMDGKSFSFEAIRELIKQYDQDMALKGQH
ncbi:MAG: hypothetical protein ACTHNW_04935 [Mucilaginibacter sp.]